MKNSVLKKYVENFKNNINGPFESIKDEILYEILDINKDEFTEKDDDFDFNIRLSTLLAGILTYNMKLNIILDGFNKEKHNLITYETKDILNDTLSLNSYESEDYSNIINKLEYYKKMLNTDIKSYDFNSENEELLSLIKGQDIYDMLRDETLKEDIYECIFLLAIKDNEPSLEGNNSLKIS